MNTEQITLTNIEPPQHIVDALRIYRIVAETGNTKFTERILGDVGRLLDAILPPVALVSGISAEDYEQLFWDRYKPKEPPVFHDNVAEKYRRENGIPDIGSQLERYHDAAHKELYKTLTVEDLK